jgi:XTP/dITP diphosphohydrolase
MKVVFVTSNSAKVIVARAALGRYGIELAQRKLKIEEIQALDVREVAIWKAKIASKRVRAPFIVEDSGLEIKSLNGFPGALLKPFHETIGAGRLLRLVHGSRSAAFINTVAFCNPLSRAIKTFSTTLAGTLSNTPGCKKITDWGISDIFIPEGWKKTISDFSKSEMQEFRLELEGHTPYAAFGKWYRSKTASPS